MQSFLSRSDAKGTRSTALHSLQWALGLLLASLPPSLLANAPDWLLVTLLCSIAIVLLVYIGAFVFLLIRNPDALRSEQFTLSKMALEKGLVGDNVTGVIESASRVSAPSNVLALDSDEGSRK